MTTTSATSPALGQDARYIPADLLRLDLGGGRTLRLAVSGEFDEVGRVLQSAFTTGCWVTAAYRAGLSAIAERAERSHVWVVSDSEGILGAVLTPKPQQHADRLFTFSILGVGPRGRGLGLGWQLTDHSVALARAYGFPGVALRSSPQMTAAHDLYYRYGFVRRPEWETAVVDSGQRLFAFSYRIADPAPRPDIPYEAGVPNHDPLEPLVSIDSFAPAGSHDSVGDFHPGAPTRPGPFRLAPGRRYRLVTPLDSPRATAALAARRLSRAQESVKVVVEPDALSPRLLGADGSLVSDDWRALAAGIAASTESGEELYPVTWRPTIDSADALIHRDLVTGLERAVFAASAQARVTAGRVFYARLGDLDLRLSTRRYLLGERLTIADLSLLAVLVGFDLKYRARLGWGAAAIADYPDLWAYGRGLLQRPDIAGEEELRAVGLRARPDGSFAEPWGPPPPVEGIADLRAAWAEDDDRALGAA